MAKIDFEVGDLVKLKSGGPTMTVEAIDDDDVTCRWFNTSDLNVDREAVFNRNILIPILGSY